MIIKLIIMISVSLYYVGTAFAWDDQRTHPDLTKVAIEKSGLDQYLKNILGLSKGIGTKYKDVEIVKLLQNGSSNEDIPLRGYNHFWNPIHNEGLNDSGCGLHFSGLPNMCWAMGETQDGQSLDDCGPGDHSDDEECNDYSWRRAREAYYEALTSSSDETKNNKFIEFYEKLGRVLHLLQDVAVPAHTRNDMFGHLSFTGFEGYPLNWGGNLFEYWVKTQLKRNGDYIFQQSDNILIPMFTRPENYWDNEVYNGAGPEITLPVDGKERSGLAEYSNANFLSKCTMFTEDLPFGASHYFPYPNKSSMENMPPQIVIAEDGKIDKVRYLRKCRHGEVIENFAQARYFCEGLHITLTDTSLYYRLAFQLDDKVHEAYAEKLIPKTVGYTAGLINYFFRGQLEITAPDEFVYAIIDGSSPQQQFNIIKAKVKNISVREKDAQENIIAYEPIEEGQLQAVAKYKKRPNYQADLSGDPPTYEQMKDVEYSFSVSEGIDIASLSTDQPEEFTFDFSTNPIPVGITDLYLQVIFKGTLGNEEDIGIAIGMKDLNEPDHYTIWNSTDMIELFGVLRTPQEIYTNPSLFNLLDTNYNGILDEDECQIDPFNIKFSVAFLPQDATAITSYNAIYNAIPAKRYGKVIVLTGEPVFKVFYKSEADIMGIMNALYTMSATINQGDETDWNNRGVIDFRGINSHFYFSKSICCNDTGVCVGNQTYPNVEGANLIPVPATNLVP